MFSGFLPVPSGSMVNKNESMTFAGLDSTEEWNLTLQMRMKKKFEKSRKKVLTNVGTGVSIMKLSDRDSEKHKTSIERLKNK